MEIHSYASFKMYRLLCTYCVLSLLQGVESAYAQNSASVPVTIILEVPNASETAPPELRVSPTELSVTQASRRRLNIWLSSMPTGSVTVSLEVTDPPTNGDVGDVSLSPSSLTFTGTDYEGRKPVDISAASDAETGSYTIAIELTLDIGGILDTETVAVTVQELVSVGATLPRTIELYPGEESDEGLFLIDPPHSESVTLSLSIEDPVPYLRVEPSTLIYTEDNHNIPQYYKVVATETAVAPSTHTLLILYPEGEHTEIRGEIKILAPPCSLEFSETADLDFGAWHKPRTGETGSVTVNANWTSRTGTPLASSQELTRATGGQPSVGKVKLTPTNCASRCRMSVSLPQGGLKRHGYSQPSILFEATCAWGRTTVQFPELRFLAVDCNHIIHRSVLEDGQPSYFQFGGEISDIDSDKPEGSYQGTMTAQVMCPEG